MRQQLEIVVVTSVDVDDWVPEQKGLEQALKDQVATTVLRITGDLETTVDLEYGEPV